MAYPLDILGNYNVVRNALKEAKGNAETLFQNIGSLLLQKKDPKYSKTDA